MSTVEGSDTHRERKVVRLLSGLELEVFDGHSSSGEPTGSDELGRPCQDLCVGLGRTVDRQHVAFVPHSFRHGACCGTGTAPDLDDAQPREKRKRRNDGGQAR